jgi:hypothetical protein
MSDAYDAAIEGMSRDMYDRLVGALQTGKWPDGRTLTPEQKEHAMSAVIAWGARFLPPEERVGYIDKGHKAGDLCDDDVQTITLMPSEQNS